MLLNVLFSGIGSYGVLTATKKSKSDASEYIYNLKQNINLFLYRCVMKPTLIKHIYEM
jgi:hypothetical protein